MRFESRDQEAAFAAYLASAHRLLDVVPVCIIAVTTLYGVLQQERSACAAVSSGSLCSGGLCFPCGADLLAQVRWGPLCATGRDRLTDRWCSHAQSTTQAPHPLVCARPCMKMAGPLGVCVHRAIAAVQRTRPMLRASSVARPACVLACRLLLQVLHLIRHAAYYQFVQPLYSGDLVHVAYAGIALVLAHGLLLRAAATIVQVGRRAAAWCMSAQEVVGFG